MAEAVQLMARSEGVLLDPVHTGEIMAGMIGMAGDGARGRVLFPRSCGEPRFIPQERLLR